MLINIYQREKNQANPFLVKRDRVKALEPYLTVALIIFFSDGVNSIAPLHRALAILSYVFVFFAAIRYINKFFYFATLDPFLAMLVLLPILSVFWSNSPNSTILNFINLARVTGFGIYFAIRYSFKEQIRLLLWAFGILIFVSFFIGFADPGRGIASSSWKSGFPHKNYFGRAMVISAATFMVSFFSAEKKNPILLLGFLLSLMLVVLSRSTNALFHVIFMFLVLLPFCRIICERYEIKAPFLGLSIIPLLFISTWFLDNRENIAVEYFGKENSLQGRDDLKKILIDIFFWDRPLFGHGHFGFWGSRYDEVVVAVSKIQNHSGVPWVPTHAHSGFIDLALSLGMVGVAIFAIGFIVAYLNSISFIVRSKTMLSFWPFIFLTLFFLSNINVNMTILSSRDLMWALYTSTTISLKLWPKNQHVY